MTIDKVRDYWNARPCNSRRSRAPVGSQQWAGEVVRNKLKVEPHILEFLRPERWYGKSVLDAGCGIGILAYLSNAHGAQVTAVDLSPYSLNLASSLLDALAVYGQVTLLTHNLEEPLPVAWYDRFDLVYSYGVLHHTPRPDLALRALWDVLKPEGELRIMLYHRWSTKALGLCLRHPISLLRYGVDATVALQSEAQARCPITRTYSKDSARKLLEENGFRVSDIQVRHIFPWAIPAYQEGRYQKTWYWRLVPDTLFRWLERRLGWHLLILAYPE